MSSSTQTEGSSYRVGETVSVRDKQGSPWLSGKVTSTTPLEVQVEGWPVPMSFAFIRKSQRRTGGTWADFSTTSEVLKGHILGVPSVRHQYIPKGEAKHVIGKNGNIINRIRAKTGAKILIFDENTITENNLRDNDNFRNYYSTKIRITGPRSNCEAARSLINEVLTNFRQAQMKYQRWLYYSTRPRYSSGISHRDPWIQNEYDLMKRQHGANGSWFTRKFKNKGRDRSNRKCQAKKKKDYLWKNRKNMRKPGRKMILEESRRRCSY